MLLSENELPTSPQLFDKQILESVIGSLLSKMKVAAMRNMKAKMRKLFRTLTLLNVVVFIMNGKTEQCLRYPDHVAWKNDGTLDQCARDVLL